MPTRATHRSRILPIVLIGFVLILLMAAAFWYLSSRQSQKLIDVLGRSGDIVQEMELIEQLTELARSRTRLTQRMLYIEDPDEREQINIELGQRGARFALLRKSLQKLPLTPGLRSLLDEQRPFIRQARALQELAAALALKGGDHTQQEAGRILATRVYPAQSGIIDRFLEMQRIEKSRLTSILKQAQQLELSQKQLQWTLILLMLAGGLIIILIMIRAIRRMERNLLHEREKAAVTLGNISDAVVSTDPQGLIEYANPVAASLFGQPLARLEGKPVIELLESCLSDGRGLIAQMRSMLESGGYHSGVASFRVGFRQRPRQALSVSLSPISTRPGMHHGLVLSFRDVSEAEDLLNKVRYLASHDTLTDLLNRRAFEQRVRKILEQQGTGREHVFGLLDLDQFKIINDSAGHAAGDELLRQLARQLAPLFGSGDLLCRLGGDEFAFFLRDADEKRAVAMARKLLDVVEGFGFSWEDNIYRCTASLGLVPVKSGLIDYDYLYQSADLACYTAKNEGRNRWHFMALGADLQQQKVQEAARLKYLTRSLERGENLLLFKQDIEPISPRMEGHRHAEVLIRMRGVDGKVVSPMAFLPLAERYGLMAKLDRWVLKRVCEFISEHPADHRVYAVNLSGQSLSSLPAMKELLGIIIESRIPPERLCIEVTETVAIGNLEIARKFMKALRQRGCSIALDDFGSGLSSFSYLSNLPLDYIKIDGVFIRRMSTDRAARVTVEAIHFIARKLGLRTVAEFVEDEDSVRRLQKIGIDLAQGYHYGRPEPLEAEDTIEITQVLRGVAG
jgi:diguanylate cyclase (GGDEF)-like protein/PAS domain S-box-containing protein